MPVESYGVTIITGCQRSGTTLLRTILEGHSALLVHHAEPQFFVELYKLGGLGPLDACYAIEHILSHPYHEPSITREYLARDPLPRDLAALARRYVEAWAGGQTRRHLVIKDPALVFHLDLADTLFPGCRVIHVVRDPRANVSSQRQRWPQFSVWTSATRWRRAVRAGRRWGTTNSHRYLEIKYESLLQEPEATIRELCRKLSIDYESDLLSFRQRETIYDPESGATRRLFTGPDPSRMNLWRDRLTKQDVRLIEIACSDEMKWWHYEPSAQPVRSVRLVLRLLKEVLAHRVYRLGKYIKLIYRRLRFMLLFGEHQTCLDKSGRL